MRKNRDCMTSGRKMPQVISALAAAALVGALGFAAFAMADVSDGDSDKAGTENVLALHQGLGLDLEKVAADAQAALAQDAAPVEKSAATLGTREFCLGCHDWDSIVDSTMLPGDVTVYNKQGLYNVHDNHNGLVNCSDCHSIDGTKSTLSCVGCHYMELPAGWTGFY